MLYVITPLMIDFRDVLCVGIQQLYNVMNAVQLHTFVAFVTKKYIIATHSMTGSTGIKCSFLLFHLR